MNSIRNHKIIALIPARMGSSQLQGKPMIRLVYENVKQNKLIADVAVATCDWYWEDR